MDLQIIFQWSYLAKECFLGCKTPHNTGLNKRTNESGHFMRSKAKRLYLTSNKYPLPPFEPLSTHWPWKYLLNIFFITFTIWSKTSQWKYYLIIIKGTGVKQDITLPIIWLNCFIPKRSNDWLRLSVTTKWKQCNFEENLNMLASYLENCAILKKIPNSESFRFDNDGLWQISL